MDAELKDRAGRMQYIREMREQSRKRERMKFILEIELGNDAMQTPEDIAYAIDAINTWPLRFTPGQEEPVRDINGNTVGKWQITE